MWLALSSQACCLSTFPEGKPRPWHTHSPALADRKALGPRGEVGKLVVNFEAKTITILFLKVFKLREETIGKLNSGPLSSEIIKVSGILKIRIPS